jgi:hypothetical protein
MYICGSWSIIHQFYYCLQVARNEDLVEQIGRDIYFDLVDHEKVHSFRIQKQMSFNFFKVYYVLFYLLYKNFRVWLMMVLKYVF